MSKAVKMADIAEKLGVSTVTVSKALNGQKGVSEELRQRIRETAGELGYRFPASVKSQGESLTVGVLMSEVYIAKYETFYWEFYQKILAEAAKRNCFVLLEVLSADAEKARPDVKLLREQRIDGLIVLGALSDGYLAPLQKSCHVPMVYLDFYSGRAGEYSIISNSFYGSYLMTCHLLEKGHRKIAFVGTPLATDSITDRYLGFRKAMMERGAEVREDWIIPDRDQPRRCFEKLVLPQTLPSAFVCNCDQTAAAVIRALEERGVSVPEQVSVVGYDDYLYPGLCSVALTTYAVDMGKMAGRSVEVLTRMIRGGTYRGGVSTLEVVEGRLVERDSVREWTEDAQEAKV